MTLDRLIETCETALKTDKNYTVEFWYEIILALKDYKKIKST